MAKIYGNPVGTPIRPDALVQKTEHANDTNIHVTAEEKSAWNKKTNFSGSWNDLKDRPFGEEIETETVVEENTVTTTKGFACWFGDMTEYAQNIEFNNGGESFAVTMDGTLYKCLSWHDAGYESNTFFIGDSRIWGSDDNMVYESNQEDVPFLIEAYFEGDSWFGEEKTLSYVTAYYPDSNPHTIKIEKITGETTKVIDEKYLPESVKNGGSAVAVVAEPAEEDIPRIFFDKAIPQTKDDVVTGFRYISKTKDISGFAEFKAQGNSSMSYPKKNMTVKMYADESLEEKLKLDFKGWGEQSKYVYKANWIDLTHARNIVSARLWADVVKSRADYERLPELYKTSPNQGAVDGFPVKVYSEGVYQGRYTLNIPKDAWMANMDDSLNEHCILCGEGYEAGCFRNASMSQWTDEVHDSVPTTISNRWKEIIGFVMNSTDEDFKANLGNYFFVDSLIDYFIFGVVSCGLDGFGKNQLYMTYNGMKWIAGMYDMDSTWGLYWNGASFVSSDYSREEFQDYKDGQGNLLYIRLVNAFKEKIKERYEELKCGALSVPNIIARFERFTDIVPLDLVKEDYASTTANGNFTYIPSQSSNNIQQIRKFIVDRYSYCDGYFATLGEEEPEIPDQPEENVTYLYQTYSPAGESFAKTVNINFEDGDYIEAEIDMSGCVNANENIISFGTSIGTWGGTANVHANYSSSSNVFEINAVDSDNNFSRFRSTQYGKVLTMRLDKNGIALDGKIIVEDDFNVAGDNAKVDGVMYQKFKNALYTLTKIQIGSQEGTTRSNATYNYIKVFKVNTDVNVPELMYAIDRAVTLTGGSATTPPTNHVDTGVELFDTNKDFTVVLEFQNADTQPYANNQDSNPYPIMHSTLESNPYPGVDVSVHTSSTASTVDRGVFSGTDKNGIYVTNMSLGIDSDNTDKHKIVIVRENLTPSVKVYDSEGLVGTLTGTSISTYFNQTLLVGAMQNTSGVKSRAWNGTIHELKVYAKAFTDDEITEYFS